LPVDPMDGKDEATSRTATKESEHE